MKTKTENTFHSIKGRHYRSNCPCCGSDYTKYYYNVVKSNTEYILLRCNLCRLVFVENPAINDLSSHSNSLYVPPRRRRHPQISRFLKAFFKGKTSRPLVVEIGSGCGGLATLLEQDSCFEYIGFELDLVKAEYTQKLGLNVHAKCFSRGDVQGHVDAIVLDNVLEHVMHPRELIIDITKILRPEGVIVVVVPNLYDVRRFIPAWRKKYYWQPEGHINYFSYRSLSTLMKCANLSTKPFNYFSINISEDLLYFPKVTIDLIGIRMLGLYCYSVSDPTRHRQTPC